MDDDEGKVEISTEVSKSSTENDTVAALSGQIDELKRELDGVKKKLHKAEFERDNAQKNAENLKREVKELSKKLQEERKKNAGGKREKDIETFQGWYTYCLGRLRSISDLCFSLSPKQFWPVRLWSFKFLACYNAPQSCLIMIFTKRTHSCPSYSPLVQVGKVKIRLMQVINTGYV